MSDGFKDLFSLTDDQRVEHKGLMCSIEIQKESTIVKVPRKGKKLIVLEQQTFSQPGHSPAVN
jgi:hypothetical protein